MGIKHRSGLLVFYTSFITDVLVNGQSVSTVFSNVGPSDAGSVIGPITLVTNPPGGGQITPITLGGPDGSLFSVTNGGMVPCNLIVGTTNIPGRAYSITFTVS